MNKPLSQATAMIGKIIHSFKEFCQNEDSAFQLINKLRMILDETEKELLNPKI
jgi:hypothetical protein